ncbi:MAG: peptide ABC transporter substrate-binding protein [Chlamydiales bacterium]|nr:peptide ABC transporter substrate-binding protein [Chlamydiales bacterium]
MRISPTQILRINNQGDLSSLHPHTGIDLMCRNFQKALFEGLTRLNPEGVPELAGAEKLEISPDKTRYTFTIRRMVWTNGEIVTSSHFEQAWKAAIAPDSNALRADLFYCIKNAEKAKKREVPLEKVGIQAVDASTLVVDLEHPTPYFLDLVASALYSPLYDNCENPTLFNGPFRLAKWEHDKELVLEKNPDYWDADSVYLEAIHTSLVNDPNTVILMYEKGEIDWVGHPFTNLPLDSIEKISNSPTFHSKAIDGVYWISLNTEKFPLNSTKIRRALSVALNREALARHVALGEAPTKSLVPLSLSSLTARELYPDSDLRKARKLFDEGLRELNLTRDEFPNLLYSYSDIPGQKKLAEAIQQQWERTLGIQVELIPSEWNVFFANLGERQFQIGGCIWFCAFNDPIYTLEFFKEKAHRYNAPQWENDHYRQLLDLADAEPDPKVRLEHLKQAELLILDEMPIIPLYMVHAKYLKSPRVQGLTVNDLGQADFKWAYVEESVPSLSEH